METIIKNSYEIVAQEEEFTDEIIPKIQEAIEIEKEKEIINKAGNIFFKYEVLQSEIVEMEKYNVYKKGFEDALKFINEIQRNIKIYN